MTAETVNAIRAIPTEMSAALLNSGTFGVEVGLAVAEVPGLDKAVAVEVMVNCTGVWVPVVRSVLIIV